MPRACDDFSPTEALIILAMRLFGRSRMCVHACKAVVLNVHDCHAALPAPSDNFFGVAGAYNIVSASGTAQMKTGLSNEVINTW